MHRNQPNPNDTTLETEADVAESATSAEDAAAEIADGALREAVDRATAAEEERDQYLDKLRRLAADFDNFKKRQVREREQLVVTATERLVVSLLPVLDDLERAVDAFEQHDSEKVREGVSLVHRALGTLLQKEGVTAVDPEGQPFDPHVHEALTMQSVAGFAEGTVIQVIQRGYLLGDRVIRPARVVVAAAPPPDSE
jgi:molecular chaperone GrpE